MNLTWRFYIDQNRLWRWQHLTAGNVVVAGFEFSDLIILGNEKELKKAGIDISELKSDLAAAGIHVDVGTFRLIDDGGNVIANGLIRHDAQGRPN